LPGNVEVTGTLNAQGLEINGAPVVGGSALTVQTLDDSATHEYLIAGEYRQIKELTKAS